MGKKPNRVTRKMVNVLVGAMRICAKTTAFFTLPAARP
jgi:hypothetical protein